MGQKIFEHGHEINILYPPPIEQYTKHMCHW